MQQQHHRTVEPGELGDNINQSVKSDKVMISQKFDCRWRRLSGSDNIVASEQQQQLGGRHKKLNHHHHHHRQFRQESQQQKQQQQVADSKRNNELQFAKYNTGTTAAAALVELLRQERAKKRMSEPLRPTNELIDLELARLNNLRLSDDLNYIASSTQLQQDQQTFLIGQPREQHQSGTMIITSGANNINSKAQQAPRQQQQPSRQAEPMGTTGALAERPLVVVSAPSGPSDHHYHHDHHHHHHHNRSSSLHMHIHQQHQDQKDFEIRYLTSSGGQLTSGEESRGDAASGYFCQDAQQHAHRDYQSTHEHYQSSYDDDRYHTHHHHRPLDTSFDQRQVMDGGGQYRDQPLQQEQQVSYVDLDEIKVHKQQQQHLQYHQVVLIDRNKTKSPVYLPESVIRVNSQAVQQPPEASGSNAHEQFGQSGQYSQGYIADHAAAHHLHHQLLSSSIDDDRCEHAQHRQEHEQQHDHHRHQHHAHSHQLTSLDSVQPSSLIRVHSGHKQSMDAHNYDHFASSSINSTYSSQNDGTNLNQSYGSHHRPQLDQQTATTTTSGGDGLQHQRTQVLLPSSMPLVFDDSHEVIVIQDHEQLSTSGHYHGKTSLTSPQVQDDSLLSSSAAGPASYTHLECGRPQQRQQEQHHNIGNVNELYNQSRCSNLIGDAAVGGGRGGSGGSGGSGSQLGEPMDEFKVCEWHNCGNTFLDMEEFVHHLEMSHVNQEPREKNRYFCLWSNCKRNNQEFNARYKLLIHMRVHSGEKPYSCQSSNCKKSFSRLENLKIHVRSHTGQKPYKCNYDNCSKSFTNSSDRIKHHKTHKDPKPYNCTHDGCTKRYTDPSSLRKHLRAHKRQYDGTSTSVASTIVSGSSASDTYNQLHTEDQLNSSYTSTGQQEQFYAGAIVSNQQNLLSSSSASATYNQVHEPQPMTDYGHSKKEFEAVHTGSNIIHNQSTTRYDNAGPTGSEVDHSDRCSGGPVSEFLDLDLQQHQQRQQQQPLQQQQQPQQQQQQQQQPQGGARKTTFANVSPGRFVSNNRYGQVSGFRHNNSSRNLRINEIRHQQLSRSWCAGGSSSSSSSFPPQSRVFGQRLAAEDWQSSTYQTQPSRFQSQVSAGHQYQDNSSARQLVPMDDSQQWAPSTGTSGGDAMSRSSTQLSSFPNNDHQLQQAAARDNSSWQQQPLRAQQHEQLMRSMPAGLPGARLSDTLFNNSSQQHQQDFSWRPTNSNNL